MVEPSPHPYDDCLRQRMMAVGLSSWAALQQKAGISRRALDQLRKGDCGSLKLAQLQTLATSLDWSLATLLDQLQILSSAAINSGSEDLASTEDSQDSPTPPLTQAPQASQASQDPEVAQDPQESQESQMSEETSEASPVSQDLQRPQATQASLASQPSLSQPDSLQEGIKTSRRQTFESLQPLLTQYPSVRHMAELKPDLPAQHLTALFHSLDNLITDWGYDIIGPAWTQVPYDPQLHLADQSDITPGEEVYIRFVGYRTADQILCPAKVSRTLPNLTVDPETSLDPLPEPQDPQ